MSIWVVVLFIVGFALIIKGGDWFVEAAVWIAEITGIPKILIGATIVSLATTLPELSVSLFAVVGGSDGLGIGNAIGSIICNSGLILSIALIISPPKIDKKLFLGKSFILVAAVITLTVISIDKVITPIESIYLFALLAIFIIYNLRGVKNSKNETPEKILVEQKEIRHIDTSKKNVFMNVLKFIGGAAGIIVGADLLVDNGIIIASFFGVSESIIGLTVVALGTSLPELVTTITSLVKKHGAMGIGNILGANILNIVLVLSTCAVSSKDGLKIPIESFGFIKQAPRTLIFDIPIVGLMLAIIILPVLFSKKGNLRRIQGVLLMAIYIGFLTFIAFTLK